MGYEESGSAVALWSEHWDPDSKPSWVIVLYSWDEYFLLSQRLSLPRSINGYRRIVRKAWWNARGSSTALVASCYRNRDKFQLNGPLDSSSPWTFLNLLSILFHPRSLSPIRLFSTLEGENCFLKAFQHLQTGSNSKKKITCIQLPSHRPEALGPEVPALEGPPFYR